MAGEAKQDQQEQNTAEDGEEPLGASSTKSLGQSPMMGAMPGPHRGLRKNMPWHDLVLSVAICRQWSQHQQPGPMQQRHP